MMDKSTAVLARALYNNQPETKNELYFRKGDILTVIEIDYDGQPGWWMCALRGQRGICPGNYLELVEDKYSVPFKSRKSLQEDLENGCTELEWYDIPRSQTGHRSGHTETSRPSAIYVNDLEGKETLGLNHQPGTVSKVSPLELYDIPSFELPTYATFGDSLARKRLQYDRIARDSGHCPSSIGHSISVPCTSSSNCDLTSSRREDPARHQAPPPPRRAPSRRTGSAAPLSPPSTARTIQSSAQHSPPPPQAKTSSVSAELADFKEPAVRLRGNRSRELKGPRSSVVSESAESGVVMVSSALPTPQQELYDVPRGAAGGAEGGEAGSSRPQSSMSMSSSGVGLSIANSGSKDSLDMYDVPRSVHTYVRHLETKYEQLPHPLHQEAPHLSRTDLHSTGNELPSYTSRHNESQLLSRRSNVSCASSYSGYGYGHSQSRAPSSLHSVGSEWGGRQSLDTPAPTNDDLYDVPRSQRNVVQKPPSVSASASVVSLQTNSSEEAEGATYDVPTPYARKVLSTCDSTETLSCSENVMDESSFHLDLGASSSSFFPKAPTNDAQRRWTRSCVGGMMAGDSPSSQVKILPLSPKAAVSVLERLRQEVMKSVLSILDSVKPKWRSKNNLAEIMPEIRFSVTRLNLAVKDLCDFCSRSLSNAIKLGDEGIQSKLQRLLTPLINASQIIQRDLDELDAYFWSVDRLSLPCDKSASPPDALDQLVLCARSLKHDVTEIANFLALNSSALFSETDASQLSASLLLIESESALPVELEDYDYVSLVKEDTRDGGGGRQREKGVGATAGRRDALDWRDELLLEFYSVQIGGTAPLLSQSISTFISAIHQNEPPKVFNGHLKYVILLAYKMLFAGDTVHRNLSHPQLKEQIESKANDLNKSIFELTEASKIATRDFPKIPPMQVIIDRVWNTTAAATQLKKVIFNALL